jgi:hypothetical protein
MLWHEALKTVQHDWLHLQYKDIFGKEQAKFSTDKSYTCDNEKSH